MKYGLTKKQRKLYDFIIKEIDENGRSPSFEEMAAGMGLKNKGNIHRYIQQLVDRGWVEYIPYKARTIAPL